MAIFGPESGPCGYGGPERWSRPRSPRWRLYYICKVRIFNDDLHERGIFRSSGLLSKALFVFVLRDDLHEHERVVDELEVPLADSEVHMIEVGGSLTFDRVLVMARHRPLLESRPSRTFEGHATAVPVTQMIHLKKE